MDWLEFLASVIGSIAWPVTVGVLVFLLRDPVKRALLTLTRLKYKDFELDFARELKQLEKKVSASDVKPQMPRLSAGAPKDASALLDEALRLSVEFPAPAISVAWQAVEEELLRAVQRLAISPDYPHYNSSAKNIQLLREQKAIDDETFEFVQRMRRLRNAAVHGQTQSITGDEALEFISIADGIVRKLRNASRG